MALSLAACGGSSTPVAVVPVVADPVVPVVPVAPVVDAAKSIALKTTVDLAPETTGGSGADVYVADNTGTANTLTAADELNGGLGTDTLKIYSDGDGDVSGNLTSIEVVSIYDLTDTFDITDVTGVTTLNVIRGDGTQSIKVDGGETVNLENFALSSSNAAADVSIDFGATATSATIGLNKIVAGATPARDDVTLVGAKLTTVNVNVTGTKSVVEKIDAVGATAVNIDAAVALETNDVATTSAAATLTITGAGKVDVGALDVGFTTVNAAGNSGGIVAAIGTNDQTVLTGSAGNDVITASTTDALASADKLAVNAGAGTDTLVIAAAADVNTAADAARYTGFETVRVTGDLDMSLIAGVTAIEVSSGGGVYTKMTAAQLGDITFLADNTTSTTFTLETAAGTTDVANIKLASATATLNVDVIGVSVVGVETVNVIASTGTNTSGDSDFGFLADSADSVKAVNISGSADVDLNIVANTFDVVAATIDASGLTGTGHLEITGGVLFNGSKVIGSDNADTIAISSTTGTTYESGKGDDAFTGSLADLVQTGSADNKINGGEGTDKITLDDTTTTLTDNHFMGLSNVETLALSNTVGDAVITTGAGFNTAFASGITITTGTMAVAKDLDFNGGLATVDIKLTVDATSVIGDATDVNAIDTGSGNDTVTFTGDDTYVGAAGAVAQGTITINTNAGDDTISVTIGTLETDANTTGGQAITITGGTGADTITKVGVNGDDALGVAHFVIADGDSLAASYDKIVGFDASTATTFSDALDFGTVAIGTVSTHNDFGTIASSSTTAGVVTFDDAAGFATALVIDSSNLADVLGYLNANTAAGDTVAFAFDKNADGTNDSTMVWNNSASDSLVLLDGTTGIDSLITTNASAGDGDVFIM